MKLLFAKTRKTEGDARWGEGARLRAYAGFRTLRHVNFETSR